MKKERINIDQLEKLTEQLRHGKDESLLEYGVTINDKIISGNFRYSGSTSIHFVECIFLDSFTLYNNNFQHNIDFKFCYFLKQVSLLNIQVPYYITFMNCKAKNN